MKKIKNFILSTIIATTAISTTAIAEDFQVYGEIGPSIIEFASDILPNIRPNLSVGGAYKIDQTFSVGLRANIQGKGYTKKKEGAAATEAAATEAAAGGAAATEAAATEAAAGGATAGGATQDSNALQDSLFSIQAEGFVKVYDQDALSVKLGLGSGMEFKAICDYSLINSYITKIEYALEEDLSLLTTVRVSMLNMEWSKPQMSITFGLSCDL